MNNDRIAKRFRSRRWPLFLRGLGLAGCSCRHRCSCPRRKRASAASTNSSYDGKPTDGKSFITPLSFFNGVIYIAGQGAHSHDGSDVRHGHHTHTTKVMDNVKNLVEAGGGTMDSILQLTVYPRQRSTTTTA